MLQDWNDGRIAYYTLPPPKGPEAAAAESASLVSAPAPEFDAEAAYGAEGKAVIAELPPLASAEEGNAARKRAAWFEAQTGAPVQIADLDGEDEAAEQDSDDEDTRSRGQRVPSQDDCFYTSLLHEPCICDGHGCLQRRNLISLLHRCIQAFTWHTNKHLDMQCINQACACVAAARGAQSASQTQALYQLPGQYNPHAARAERKRAKREARGGVISSHAADALADMMLGGGVKAMSDDEDYDIDEAFEGEDDAGSEGSAQEESEEQGGSIDDGDVSVEDLDS